MKDINYKELFKTAPRIITVLDENKRIIGVNNETFNFLLKEFKMPSSYVLGKYCYEIFMSSSSPCEGCFKISEFDESINLFTHKAKHRILELEYSMSARPVFNSKGKIKYIIHTTEKVHSEQNNDKLCKQCDKKVQLEYFCSTINDHLTSLIGQNELMKQENISSEFLEQKIHKESEITGKSVLDIMNHMGIKGKEISEVLKGYISFS